MYFILQDHRQMSCGTVNYFSICGNSSHSALGKIFTQKYHFVGNFIKIVPNQIKLLGLLIEEKNNVK